MNPSFLSVISALSIGLVTLPALEIELRYDLDTDGFFDQPGAKEAMRAVADFYEDLIVDELEAIDPTTFPTPRGIPARTWHPNYVEPAQNSRVVPIPGGQNMVVPANTIIVYPGGRDLPSAGLGGPGGFSGASGERPPFDWSNQLFSRNEPGALRINSSQQFNTPTDFAPWGGVLFFDKGLSWNFSTTDSETHRGVDFVSIALHEMAHVLGFGQVGSSRFRWMHLVERGEYIGEIGRESEADAEVTNFPNHWSADSPMSFTLESFGQSHGQPQVPLMVAVAERNSSGQFAVMTDVDLAALQDIGWEIAPSRANFAPTVAFAKGQPAITFPTTTGIDYMVERGSLPDKFTSMGEIICGDGSLLTVTDPAGMAESAFYRVTPLPAATPAAQSNVRQMSDEAEESEGEPVLQAVSLAPSACQCGAH